MTPRVTVELLHLAAGLVVTTALFAAAIWSYPQARGDFHLVGAATLVAVLVMGIGPVRRARRADRRA